MQCTVHSLQHLLADTVRHHRLQRVHICAERPQAHLLHLAPVDEMGVRVPPGRWELVLVIRVGEDSECAWVLEGSIPPHVLTLLVEDGQECDGACDLLHYLPDLALHLLLSLGLALLGRRCLGRARRRCCLFCVDIKLPTFQGLVCVCGLDGQDETSKAGGEEPFWCK